MIGRAAEALGVLVGETVGYVRRWWWLAIIFFFLSPLIRPGEPPVLAVASTIFALVIMWVFFGAIYIIAEMLDLSGGPKF